MQRRSEYKRQKRCSKKRCLEGHAIFLDQTLPLLPFSPDTQWTIFIVFSESILCDDSINVFLPFGHVIAHKVYCYNANMCMGHVFGDPKWSTPDISTTCTYHKVLCNIYPNDIFFNRRSHVWYEMICQWYVICHWYHYACTWSCIPSCKVHCIPTTCLLLSPDIIAPNQSVLVSSLLTRNCWCHSDLPIGIDLSFVLIIMTSDRTTKVSNWGGRPFSWCLPLIPAWQSKHNSTMKMIMENFGVAKRGVNVSNIYNPDGCTAESHPWMLLFWLL